MPRRYAPRNDIGLFIEVTLKYSMLQFAAPLSPVFLYAETHFRFFQGFPSLLFKREPEIVFDLPGRCAPGRNLPVFLIVNDVHRFSAEVTGVMLTVSQKGIRPLVFEFSSPQAALVDHPLQMQAKAYVFSIPRTELPNGQVYVNCKASVANGKRSWDVLNDNFFSSSKLPFGCYLADEDLPGSDRCSYGDLHVHSQYSQSHVEFGPPVSVINLVADTCGLDFLAITDHSYDLCCDMNDYLETDSSLSRWQSLVSETGRKDNSKPIMILGEEISTLNCRSKAVHLCAIGIKSFVPGSIDGARTNKLPTLQLKQVIDEVHSQGGLAVAAHPGSRFGLLQQILLHRGNWAKDDFANNLDAVQAVNNGFGKSWQIAKRLWINELLRGRRLPLVGGNDSHGDFNRYRYISVPFLAISENFSRHLSSVRTGIYRKAKSIDDVISSIRQGEAFVTSGPYLSITPTKSGRNRDLPLQTIPIGCSSVTVRVIGNCEFGGVKNLRVFAGRVGEKAESLLFSDNYNCENQIIQEIALSGKPPQGYLRAEATCLKNGGATTFAATSPVYFGT